MEMFLVLAVIALLLWLGASSQDDDTGLEIGTGDDSGDCGGDGGGGD